ncbi:MAG: hypothetical protein V1647_03960, partial [Pseudomonadota bacterium]
AGSTSTILEITPSGAIKNSIPGAVNELDKLVEDGSLELGTFMGDKGALYRKALLLYYENRLVSLQLTESDLYSLNVLSAALTYRLGKQYIYLKDKLTPELAASEFMSVIGFSAKITEFEARAINLKIPKISDRNVQEDILRRAKEAGERAAQRGSERIK